MSLQLTQDLESPGGAGVLTCAGVDVQTEAAGARRSSSLYPNSELKTRNLTEQLLMDPGLTRKS